MMQTIRDVINDRRGATFVEYVILVGLVAIIGIAAYTTFGQNIASKVNEQATSVSNIPGS